MRYAHPDVPNFLSFSVAFSPHANYTDRATALVGEVSANFCGQKVSRGQRNGR
jgi:hypothetical protein